MTLSAPTPSTASGTPMPAPTLRKTAKLGGLLTEPVETIGVAISSRRPIIDISGSLTRLWLQTASLLTRTKNAVIAASKNELAVLAALSFLTFTLAGGLIIGKIGFYDYLAVFVAFIVYGQYCTKFGAKHYG